MNILVAEPLAPAGIEKLKAQPGWNVTVSNPAEYAQHLETCDALLVRSAVRVTADVLGRAPKLRVIGRAGVGVDNVDLPAATAAGVLVMNTPGGNAVSVAEQTLGFMLSLARHIPQACASTKAGKWEKKKFLGTELRGKTLGVLGLGAIGREVVLRAKGFEMRIIATDPYVSPATAADLGIELVERDQLYAESDYITIHVALTPETEHMLNAAAFAKMKPGVRILNCARGELVNQNDLLDALQSGQVGGAALDVFEPEPLPPDHPLLRVESLIATPHIGASTEEAQEIVGVRIVDQLVQYLREGVAINAVNMPAMSPEAYRAMGPYIALAERLGSFAANISQGNPVSVAFTYSGKIADQNTQLVRNAALAGLLNRSLSMKSNLVNAMQIATDRGLVIESRHDKRKSHVDTVTVELTTTSGTTSVEGAVVLERPRLLRVDGIYCEAGLGGNLIFLKNDDVPGVIGFIGTTLGRSNINIANFSLGRTEKPVRPGVFGAVAVVEVDGEIPESVLGELKQNPAVQIARAVGF
jgi:D-3-phosphoglycerate dehydrogenase